uniref:Sm domain-containing protein n=1 Tax=Trichuris muris TaxID=70415 RepID=A0A5S6QHW6_TRIMR
MQNREKKKKESVIDLTNLIDKQIVVKFQGGREVSGLLKGFDQLLNLVLDNTTETMHDAEEGGQANPATRNLGLIVARGNTILVITPADGMEQIANPFVQPDMA